MWVDLVGDGERKAAPDSLRKGEKDPKSKSDDPSELTKIST